MLDFFLWQRTLASALIEAVDALTNRIKWFSSRLRRIQWFHPGFYADVVPVKLIVVLMHEW
jgi:hypothetical protein